MSHASGCVQYAMRPFSLGDRIILRHVSGMVVLEGVVAALHPTRTVIVGEPELAVDASSGSSDSDSGEHKLTSFINNGDIVESMIVTNLSRIPPMVAASLA